jgi:hypothetical protein
MTQSFFSAFCIATAIVFGMANESKAQEVKNLSLSATTVEIAFTCVCI